MVALNVQQTQQRFGVSIAIKKLSDNLTPEEERNVATVLQYMHVAYSYELNKGGESVLQFCAPDNTFEAPSTFPKAHTVDGYSESHAQVLSSLTDLHIIHFDVVTAKDDTVALRYSAEGTHKGLPHNGIQATGKHATWTAQGHFVLENGKIKHWWKDWDKMQMWKKLGWVQPNDADFA
ncbi:NTF2-like protein [Exidia glandulosa HHB12029]|uniref:NTF2-like protein n=1 Tax=Exidia glandulosa HHB12029 TaxID=1314781 RepID=A0A166AZL2_EXIGL|nr:NTF2-like protein [Exidia glandulosa HHB12029]